MRSPGRIGRLLLLAFQGLLANGQHFYTYVTDLSANSIELSWWTTAGTNTIGRSSVSHGLATIKAAGQVVTSKSNQVVIAGLEPDHDYDYEITIGTTQVGTGHFRTWAANPDRVVFFVIGDYGTGKQPQRQIAEAMWKEFQRRQGSGNPVRFMLSTGDNIYGNLSSFLFGVAGTGADDRDWAAKFFDPYEPLLARIPFFGTLGNHDGNETESTKDLPAYLDNFPFPGGKPARYYSFRYGNLVRFFALDSTKNTESGKPHPNYQPGSAQFGWMKKEFAQSGTPWVIPFYHHPVFSAGPLHAPSLRDLEHWVSLFQASGVRVVFNGHEHNFQMSEASAATGGIRFIVSGAGGELRPGGVQSNMLAAHVDAWAPQNHFLVVEIEGKVMRITPVSFEPLRIKNQIGEEVKLPIAISLP